MAFVNWDSLQLLDLPLPPGTTTTDNKLRTCTAAEDTEPASFYPEDIIRITNQTDFSHLKKHMAKFWDVTKQVWVGYKMVESSEVLLKDVIVLRCPPYYPPHTLPGIDVSNTSKPPGFPSS
jgi:hypothetical protein